MRTYNFIQAVTLLPPTFSDEHLVKIFQVVSEQQPGNLQALLVVLRDDDRDRCLELVRQRRSSQPSQPSGSGVISGTFSGPGSGMGLEGSGSVPGSVILESLAKRGVIFKKIFIQEIVLLMNLSQAPGVVRPFVIQPFIIRPFVVRPFVVCPFFV